MAYSIAKQTTKLNSGARKLLYTMLYGVDVPITRPDGTVIQPGTPLSDGMAAYHIGMKPRHLDYWRHQRVFKDARDQQAIERRRAEEPNNLAMAISIRDSDPLATTRLAAIDRIRVKDPTPSVHFDLSRHDNRQQTLVAPAGYVVNLGEPMKKIEEKE